MNTLAGLLRNEKRLRDIVARLGGRTDSSARELIGRLAAGLEQIPAGRCESAPRDGEEVHSKALRFVRDQDDSSFHSLANSLWDWALKRREQGAGWPDAVPAEDGANLRYMRDLVDMHLLEVRNPAVFLPLAGDRDPRPIFMNVTEQVWWCQLSPIYEAIRAELQAWIAFARDIHTEHRANTKRPTIIAQYMGEPMSLRKLAQRTGVPHSTVTARYRRGVRGNALIDAKRLRIGRTAHCNRS